MIKIRPLIQVLGKIVGLPNGSYLDPASLGAGTPDNTKFLRGDGTWQTPSGGDMSQSNVRQLIRR